jgi:hypothetical protein
MSNLDRVSGSFLAIIVGGLAILCGGLIFIASGTDAAIAMMSGAIRCRPARACGFSSVAASNRRHCF